MLPRQFRLERHEFETVKRDGTLHSGRLMGVLLLQGQETRDKGQVRENATKAGLIVSNKLSKKATERNKLKRRLRAALMRVLPELSGVHIVVLATRRAMGATVGELADELKAQISKFKATT